MRSCLLLLLFVPFVSFAQVNDMFYVPKKDKKQKDTVKVVYVEDDEWGIADNGNDRDVDEYNRRGKSVVSYSDTLVTDVYVEDVYDEAVYDEVVYVDNYNYSTRIVRFHNPVRFMWDYHYRWDWCHYPSYHYYDNFWDTHYDYMWHTTPPPHHSNHHHRYTGSWRDTKARSIPVFASNAKGNNGRVPVASIAKGNNSGKQPVANGQVNGKVKNERGKAPNRVVNRNRVSSERRVATGNNVGGRKERVERSVQSSNRNVQRSSVPATYNRRSSTSVNRAAPSHSTNRAPVSRGGVQRGGRR